MAAASRVPTCDISSTITVVFVCQGYVVEVLAEPGDRLGVDAHGAQLGDRLVRRCQRDDRSARSLGCDDGGVDGGGLAEPRRRGQQPQRGTIAAQDPYRVGLVLPELHTVDGERRVDECRVDAG